MHQNNYCHNSRIVTVYLLNEKQTVRYVSFSERLWRFRLTIDFFHKTYWHVLQIGDRNGFSTFSSHSAFSLVNHVYSKAH